MTFNASARTAHGSSRGRRTAALAALVGVGAGLVQLQAPAASAAVVGDAFANPRIIARSSDVDSLLDTTFFTAEPGEPKHANSTATRSAWYRWQSPVTGRVTFRTQGTTFDTVMSAYVGSSLDALTSVGENDDTVFNDGTVRQSQVSFPAVAGTTYRIAVDGFSSGNLGQVVLSWDANDSFSGATPLTGPVGTQSVRSDNTGSTKEPGEPNHAGSTGGHSVWFSWKAPASGKAAFSVGGGRLADSLLAAYQGNAVNALTKVAANDDAAPGVRTSAITFAAVKGTTYRIAVDGKRSDDSSPDLGDFRLTYSLKPAA
jgi:hypothetical protein